MSQDDPSTKKYHQIVVPDHGLKSDTSGTSFLRTGSFPSLTDATKHPPGFQKSLALARLAGEHHLKTGGSWHHVDGNRIETTVGRKVEVIAGSYVAHRGPGNSPGPNFSATWATNSYTQVGSLDLPVGGDANNRPPPPPAPGSPPTDPHDPLFVETLSYRYDGALGDPTAAPVVETNQPGQPNPTAPIHNNLLQNGDVAAVTWAQRVLTYVGSASRPVPFVFAETRADTYHSYSYYSVESLTYVGGENRPVPKVYAETHAGSVGTKTFASGDITTWNHTWASAWQDTAVGGAILTTQEAAIDISVFNTAPILTTVNTGAAQATINVGMMLGTLNLGFLIGAFNIGPNLTVNMPSDVTFTGDETGVKLASADMTAAQNRINFLHSELATTVQDVMGVCDNISGASTSLSETRNHLDGTFTILNALSILGP